MIDRSIPRRGQVARLLFLFLAAYPAVSKAQQQNAPGTPGSAALKQMTLEELSEVEVTSAGKKEEKLSKVAAAVYVITQDEIRRSGARNIPEALRLAPGLEVAEFNAGSWAVSARGFDITSANKLQVFIDGRSLYSPLFGGVLWDMLNVVMEDIDRIEVIRGPGATLWGGNAVNCVINIMTRSSKDTQGVLAVTGGGAGERGFATAQYGGSAGKRTTYRVYGNYFNRDSGALANGADAQDPYQMAQGGFRLDSAATASDDVTIQGDLFSGDGGFLNRPDIAQHGGNATAHWTHRFQNGSDLQVLTYYDRASRNVPLQYAEVRNTYDFEVQHHFRAGGRHDVVWGIGYRASSDRTEPSPLLFFNPSGRHLGLFNLFVQDEIAISGDQLHLILGSKFENYTFSGWSALPTARLVWTPTSRQTLWGAVSRAVRIPTQFDEDLQITANTPTVLISGSSAFRPERLMAYEVGYRVMPDPRVSLDIATYYNGYDALRSQEKVTPPIPFPVVLGNGMRAHTYGAEASARYQFQPWWRFTAAYSNLQRRFQPDAASSDTTQGLQEATDPRNQFSLRSNMDLPHRTELDCWVRHVSALELPSGPPVPAYTVFDVRAGWRPNEHFEISIVGRNLPGRRHLEFGPFGELVRRSVYVIGTWRF